MRLRGARDEWRPQPGYPRMLRFTPPREGDAGAAHIDLAPDPGWGHAGGDDIGSTTLVIVRGLRDGTPLSVEFVDLEPGVDLTGVPAREDVARLLGSYGVHILTPVERYRRRLWLFRVNHVMPYGRYVVAQLRRALLGQRRS